MTKPMTDLSPRAVQSITRVFRSHGTDAARVRRVAASHDIAERDARALATAATTTPKAPVTARTVTESDSATDIAAGLTARDVRESFLADKLGAQVRSAEARPSLAEASTQELEALAATWG